MDMRCSIECEYEEVISLEVPIQKENEECSRRKIFMRFIPDHLQPLISICSTTDYLAYMRLLYADALRIKVSVSALSL